MEYEFLSFIHEFNHRQILQTRQFNPLGLQKNWFGLQIKSNLQIQLTFENDKTKTSITL
jgi:hypothetical protein